MEASRSPGAAPNIFSAASDRSTPQRPRNAFTFVHHRRTHTDQNDHVRRPTLRSSRFLGLYKCLHLRSDLLAAKSKLTLYRHPLDIGITDINIFARLDKARLAPLSPASCRMIYLGCLVSGFRLLRRSSQSRKDQKHSTKTNVQQRSVCEIECIARRPTFNLRSQYIRSQYILVAIAF